MTREEFDNLKVGDKVIHAFGGIGVVTEIFEIGYTVKDKGFDCGGGLISFAWYEGELIKEDALENARQEYNNTTENVERKQWLEELFPELAESEDERIRKELISFVRRNIECHDKPNAERDEKFESWLAWLEKQVDKDKLIKELGKYKVKYTQEILQNHLNSMTNKDDERLRKTTISFLKEFADKGYENAVECIDWLEMQSNTSKEVTCTQEVEVGNGNIKSLVTEKLNSTNTSTEDDVRRRSIIWVLEYARGLDTFNQYGKENIDKDIAWLENQGIYEKQGIYKVWTNNDYDKIKSIEYLLHEFNNHNFDDWFNSLKRIEEQQ